MKVKFYDKTLWSRYLAVLGVISSLVTLMSFFATATDFVDNILCIAIPFVILIILIFIKMWYCANRRDHADLKINRFLPYTA